MVRMGAAMARFFLILLGLMTVATPAHAWWNTEWKYRKPVTVDTSPSGVNLSGTIGRTVLLVRLHSGNFTFTDALQNGADIRIVDSDDKTPLPYHIEQFDPQTGVATLWVSVPTLNGGEKKELWLYFGNASAPAGEDVKGTFDPDYTAVYHFNDTQGQPVADATANNNAAQNPPAGLDEGGIIARAARFPGQGALIVPASPSLAMPAGAPLTVSAWVKPDRLDGEQALFARGSLVIGLKAGVPFVAIGAARGEAKAALVQGQWSALAVTADATTIRIYVNGVEAAAVAAALPALDGPISIGGTADRPFTGELDEVRLSKVARPAAMLNAIAQAEGPSNKLVGVSETAEKQGGSPNTFVYVLSKVEIIDAVVIGVCMLILALATTVMVAKARYVGRTIKANQQFMKRFYEMHEHLVSLKERNIPPAELSFIESGQLSKIYEMGVEELDVRREISAKRGGLSGEAVEAMRAAVDAVVVEENQKLDVWMVILTIAISGGPFIGLLGTVLGVMNTFGGVAMAGDVNVNAIAPGIAAALMATIAGLACAIPSLFGYNYLNSRISKISDDMRVFVDRLITRLAEMQTEDAPVRAAAE